MAKYAIQSYSRDQNGSLKATLVDAKTGKPVTNPDEYTVVTQTDYDQLVATGQLPSAGSNQPASNPTNKQDNQKPKRTFVKPERASDSSARKNSTATSKRDSSNSWGYKHKPGWVGATSLIPGVGGTVGKAVNLGWNANNAAAAAAARKDLGIEGPNIAGTFKDVIRDNEGYLGKTKIGTKDYGVSIGENGPQNGGGVIGGGGFLGKVKSALGLGTEGGTTTLTPQETQARRAMTDVQSKPKFNSSFAKLHPELDDGSYHPTKTAETAQNPTSAATRGITADNTGQAKSYAELAAQGYVNRTPQEKEAIAKALAGEMAGKTLKGLAVGDPKAQAEFANMVTTIENRIGKVGSVAGVLKPSQYNSLMAENMATTENNFSKYGAAILGTLDGYYAGTIRPTDYSYTSYYNPDIVTPNWTNDTFTKTGFHAFGITPDWAQSAEDAYGLTPTSNAGWMTEHVTDLSKTDMRPFADYAKSYYDNARRITDFASQALHDHPSVASGIRNGFNGQMSNRPASGNMNISPTSQANFGGNRSNNGFVGNQNTVSRGPSDFGRSDSPSSGRTHGGFGNSFGNTNSHVGSGNGNSVGGVSAGASRNGNTNTNNGFSGNSNTNDKDNEGATGSYGYGGFGGPR